MRPIIVVGDVHGDFHCLSDCLARHWPSLVLQVGDFGALLGKRLPRKGFCIADQPVAVHFCDGNHENHFALQARRRNGKLEIAPQVFYQPRGSTLTLPDGRVVLFAGGAASCDKDRRTLGVDWFPEEVLTSEEVALFPETHVDIVISHAAPTSVVLPRNLENSLYDPSREALEIVLQRYKPTLWYCGHYHSSFKQIIGGCHFTALNKANPFGFSNKLPEGEVDILPDA